MIYLNKINYILLLIVIISLAFITISYSFRLFYFFLIKFVRFRYIKENKIINKFINK